MNSQNLLQIAITLLIFGLPALTWIVRKLREQADIKAARDRQRRAEQESLRATQITERARPGDERVERDERQRAMRDLAMRRQAQLQELRERQLQAAREQQSQRRRSPQATPSALVQPGQAGPGVQPPGGPTGVGRGVPAIPAQRPIRRAPMQAPPATTIPPQQRRRDPPVARPASTPRVPQSEPRRPDPSGPAAPTQEGAEPYSVPSASHDPLKVRDMLFDESGSPRARHEIRRLLALKEVLDPPVSMRRSGLPADSM